MYNTGVKENGAVDGITGYIYSSSGDFLIQLVRFVG
jgi:hypothetical protein